MFVSESHKTKQKWTGSCYHRHGGLLHPCWWHQSRGRMSTKMPHDWSIQQLSPEQMRQWTACVYVKKSNEKATHARDSLLTTCGGQHKVMCKEHRYPLITAASKTKQKCHANVANAGCQKDAFVICPEENCKSSLCEIHFNSMTIGSETLYVSGTSDPPHHDSATEEHVHILGESGQQHDKEIPLIENGKDEEMNGNIKFRHFGYENCAIDAEFEFNEQDEDDYFVTCDVHHHDCEDYSDDEDTSDAACPNIPTTNAANTPVYVQVETEPYKSCTASNHVILNHFGSCLIRRNADMSGTKTQKSFLQRLVATTPGTSVPLLYPEGMLFTDVFYSDEADGSTAGALPVCLLHDASVLRQNGYASLEDHFRTRMSNPGILASSNPKYHFWAFDSIVNLGLRGCDTRAILRRGFTDTQKGGVSFRGEQLPIFDTEQVDCRPVVNKLAATSSERSPTYFFTWTLSMMTHFGIRLLYKHITSEDLVDKFCTPHHSDVDRTAIKKEILESAGTFLLRAWMEISHIWFAYIVKSPEQPLGEIDMHFCRAELQDPDAKGNLCHWHCILWTKDNLKSKEGLDAALDRIRGHISDIVRPNERQQLIEDGIFKNLNDVHCFLDQMQSFLNHKHLRRCYAMVRNSGEEEDVQKLVCKVSNNYQLNPNPTRHSFVSINVEHSQDAIFVFQLLGLAELNSVGVKAGEKLIFRPVHQCLISKKHTPPACGNEGIISPVPGQLVSRNPNSCNIQFTTGYLIMRYLAKYVASIDHYNVIRITPPTKDEPKDTLKVDGKLQLNTKITGNRIHYKRTEKKISSRFPKEKQARGINISEAYMMQFGYDPILTNIEWIHVATQPYEERTARTRTPPCKKYAENHNIQSCSLQLHDMVPSHLVRKRRTYPRWRMFTENQMRKTIDDLQSPYTTDSVTLFGMRPPELRFVMTQVHYAKWFKRVSFSGNLTKQINACENNLHCTQLHQSSWIDASTAFVYVRALAVPLVLDYVENCPQRFFDANATIAKRARQSLTNLFKLINDAIHLKQGRQAQPLSRSNRNTEQKKKMLLEIFDRYVCDNNKKRLPTTWFNSIRPTQPNRFLIHLLLSMGRFVDEYSLFNQTCLRNSFIHAGLLDENNIGQSIMQLTKSYITEQLSSLPAGTTTFDRYTVAAHNTIRDLFLNNVYYSAEMPSVLYCRLTTVTDTKIKKYIHSKDRTLVEYLLEKLKEPTMGQLPTKETCLNATIENPCTWDPTTLIRSPHQPVDSYMEQKRLMQVTINQIQHYKSGPLLCTKGVVVVGAGGVGKTTASLMSVLYSICQGLNVTITTINSERAQELASEHLASMLCMPRGDNLSPGQLAERCISRLYRNPEKLEYLRTRDLCFFDELGNASAEILSVRDTVLKYVKNSNRPNGGIISLGTMDNLQIDPCSGRHPLMSPLFSTSCIFFRLHKCVRSCTDINWMRIQEITRLPPTKLDDDAIKLEFLDLFEKHVGSIPINNQKHLPDNSLFIYGKNEPLKKEQKKLFFRLNSRKKKTFLISTSVDKERTVEGRLVEATSHTSDCLDKRLKEQRHIYFFLGGRYQITQNDVAHKYSNSQLAMLFEMPTQDQLDKKKPIKMLLAPPGSRHIPSDKDTHQDLIALGWSSAMVHPCCDKNVTTVSKGIRATRIQYKLRHHIGSTLHSIMGQTLTKLVTEVSRGDKSPYSLWLASQVVVLLSRTRTAADTVFVTTNLRNTAEILYDILSKTTAFRTYISELLDSLCAPYETGQPITINHYSSIYQCRNTELPIDDSGSVYLIISLKAPNTIEGTYIGSTKQLAKRLNQHNSNWGSQQTSSLLLRPWALLTYVAGFDKDYGKMKAFENEWISRRNKVIANPNLALTVKGTITLGKDLLHDWHDREPSLSLRMIECGSIQHVENMRARTVA